MITLVQQTEDKLYSGAGHTVQREYGQTPHGNPMNGRWVLRRDGEMIDFDKYFNDLTERNDLKIIYPHN